MSLDIAKVLQFGAPGWQHAGPKERAIREVFGVSPTRYYQLLGQALDTEEAWAVDPGTVRRLRAGRGPGCPGPVMLSTVQPENPVDR